MDLPDFFKCPSDSSAAVPMAGGDNVDVEGSTPFMTWEWWGTSYASNWYWPYYYQSAPPGNQAPYNGGFLKILGSASNGGLVEVPGLGAHMLRDMSGRYASEFIIFYENRLNYALEGALPRGVSSNPDAKTLRGWHDQMDYHVAAFRDGSARYRRYDTRFVSGPGWTSWPAPPWEGEWEPYDGIDD